MKKIYNAPEAAIYKVNVQSVLETTSLTTGDDLTEGVYQGGAKRRRNTAFQDDWEDEWEDENANNGVTF